MKLALASLQDAARAHLAVSIAGALPLAAMALQEVTTAPEWVEDSDFGRLLFAALFLCPPDPIDLTRAQITVGGELIEVEPGEVASHPLLHCLPTTLQDAFAAPVVAAARGGFAAAKAPSFDQVEAMETDGPIVGVLAFRVQGSTGLLPGAAVYGSLAGLPPYTRTHTFQGRPLYELGRMARNGTQSPACEVGNAAGLLAGLTAASGAIH